MKIVNMVDLFQFSNIYAVTEKIHELYANEELFAECLKFILWKDAEKKDYLPQKIC